MDGNRVRRRLILSLCALPLAACAGTFNRISSADAEAARSPWAGAPEVILVTVTLEGLGMHSGLVVAGSQRVVYDPAGGWDTPAPLEQGDLRYDMTPARMADYLGYHSRGGREVVLIRRPVPPPVADAAIAFAETRAPLPFGACAFGTSALLSRLPGFEPIVPMIGPRRLRSAFMQLDGAEIIAPERAIAGA